MEDFSVTKITVNALPGEVKEKWTVDIASPWQHFKSVSEMTEPEKEDEVIRRLSTPYKPVHQTEFELMNIICSEILRTIEKELVETLKKGAR